MKRNLKRIISFFATIAFALSLTFGVAILGDKTVASAATSTIDETSRVQMLEGASVRIGDKAETGDQAIRFIHYVKKSYFDTLVNPETGVYMIPADLLTMDELTNETPKAKKIVSQVVLEETETHYVYSTVLYNIPESSYGRDIVARAYIKNGSNYVWARNPQTRSLAYVASAALKDGKDSSGNAFNATAVQYLNNYVDKAMTDLSFAEQTYTMEVGEKQTIIPSIVAKYATDDLSGLIIKYSSNNENVATVENGKVVAKGAGFAKITATLGSTTASYTVCVSADKQVLDMSGNVWSLDISVPVGYSVTSITCDGESWGTNTSSLAIPNDTVSDAAKHGEKTATISINDGVDAYTMDVPVVIATGGISSAADFAKIQPATTTSAVYGYYVLTADISGGITAGGAGRMQPTNDGEHGFRGTFDGNGHTITSNAINGGLFCALGRGATIKNATFTCNYIEQNQRQSFLACYAIGATVENCEFNFSGITGADTGKKGLILEMGGRDCHFINVDINITGNASTLFGAHESNWVGFNANQQNYWDTKCTFTNTKINLMTADSSLSMLGEGWVASGAWAGTGTVTQFIVDGCKTAASATTETVEGVTLQYVQPPKQINILLDSQDFLVSKATHSLSLGVYANEDIYKLQSIQFNSVDVGTNTMEIVLPSAIQSDKTQHGVGKAFTVVVTTEEEIITLTIPAVLITKEIATVEDFLTLQPATTTTAVHGYYVLTNDIQTATAIAAPADGASNGAGDYGFRGTLDGRGYTFTFKVGQQGLFGTVGNGAKFKDITLEAVESTNAYRTAVFGRMVLGASFENMTFKFTNPKASNSVTNGMIAEFALRNCTFTNVDFITNKKIDCLFSGTQQVQWGFNGGGQMCTFINCTVYLMEGATITRLGATAYNGGIVYVADGCTETSGTKVDGITIESVSTREVLLDYVQDIYLTAKLQRIELGEYADYMVSSIKLGNYDFGAIPAKLAISDAFKADKANHGEQNVIVTAQKGADKVELTVPVIFITDTIETMEELFALQPTYSVGTVYGYYVLTADIGSFDTLAKSAYDLATDATQNSGFKGTIDGRGHTISLTVANATNQFGLFNRIKDATFRNVTFDCAQMYTLWGTSLLGRTIINTKFENVIFNYRNITVTDSYAYGMIAEFGLLNSTFNNVQFIINADKPISLLGARSLGFEGNTFTDCTVSLLNGSSLRQIGHTTNGTWSETSDDTVYTTYEGITVENVQEREITLSYTQDIVMTNSNSLNLAAYSGYEVTSITYGDYDLGTDINALVIPDELQEDFQSHGEGKVITVKVKKFADLISISVPVTLITFEISTISDFNAVQLSQDNVKEEIYGYYVLANDITAGALMASGQDSSDAARDGAWGFRGTLNGKNHTITTRASSRGIFGAMGSGATVKDITFTISSINQTEWATSVLGRSVVGVTFENVVFNVSNITTDSVKGLIGERTVRDCDFINVEFNIDGVVNQLFPSGISNWVGFNSNQQNFPNTLCTFTNCTVNLLTGDSSLGMLGAGYNGSETVTYQPTGVDVADGAVTVAGITLRDNTTGTYLLRNNTTPYTIVVPSSITTELQYAQTELIRFFKEATGITLETVTDNYMTHTDAGTYISLGNTKLASSAGLSVPTLKRDGAYLKTVDKTIYIVGGSDTGVINGVYELLGEIFGYEHYYKDCYTLNTELKQIELKNYNITSNPDIDYRGWGGIFYTSGMDTVTEDDTLYSYRLGSTDAYWKHSMPVIHAADNTKAAADHNSLYYFPLEMYQSSNPEFYSNESTFTSNSWGGIDAQLCYTARGNSAGTYDLMTTLAAERIEASLIKYADNTTYTAVQIGIEDCYQMCTCDGCTAVVNKYGAISATIIIFLNDVAVKVNAWMESNPAYARDLQYMFFAYHETLKAPTIFPTISEGVKMAPFVAISNMDHDKPLTDTTTRDTTALGTISNNTIFGWVKSWGQFGIATGGKPWAWSYGSFFHDYFLFYDSYNFYKTYFAELTAAGYEMAIIQQHSAQRGTDTAFFAMNAYLNTKLAWDSALNIDTLISNYMSAMYEDAADEMMSLYKKWQSIYASKLSGLVSSTSKPASKLSKSDIDALFDILDTAYAAIAHYETSDPAKYAKLKAHIDMEWLSPAKLAVTGSYAWRYKLSGDYNAIATQFETLCNQFGIVALGEQATIDNTLNNL